MMKVLRCFFLICHDAKSKALTFYSTYLWRIKKPSKNIINFGYTASYSPFSRTLSLSHTHTHTHTHTHSHTHTIANPMGKSEKKFDQKQSQPFINTIEP